MMTAGIAATRPMRGGEQRFGDAGRDHGEVGGLRFRNADKAVHDAPDGAEQSDEGRRRADGRQQAHAEPDPPRFGAHDFGKTGSGALLDAGVAGNARRQPRLAHRRRQEGRQHAALGAQRELRFRQRPRVGDLGQRRAQPCAEPRDSSIILAMKMVQVTSEAKARPIMTALTSTSADLNIDHGDNSLELGGGGLQQFALALRRRGGRVRRRGRCSRLGQRGRGLR